MDQQPNMQPKAAAPSKHYRSFWPLTIIATVAIIVAGALVWVMYNQGLSDDISAMVFKSHRVAKTNPSSQTSQFTAGWKTYIFPDNSVSFKYPPTWKVLNQSNSKKGSSDVTISTEDNFVDSQGNTATLYFQEWSSSLYAFCTSLQDGVDREKYWIGKVNYTNYGGIKAAKGVVDSSRGVYTKPLLDEEVYIIIDKTHGYFIGFNGIGSPELTSKFELVLSSIKFTK